MTSVQGLGILCFYSNGLFQGHVIDKSTHVSPCSLAGKRSNHVDPHHNDCMDKPDFYNMLIHVHDPKTTIPLLVRREKNNDAAGLSTHHHEAELNDGYQLNFTTHHFLTGDQALALQLKYFNRPQQDDVVVCIGDIQLGPEMMS